MHICRAQKVPPGHQRHDWLPFLRNTEKRPLQQWTNAPSYNIQTPTDVVWLRRRLCRRKRMAGSSTALVCSLNWWIGRSSSAMATQLNSPIAIPPLTCPLVALCILRMRYRVMLFSGFGSHYTTAASIPPFPNYSICCRMATHPYSVRLVHGQTSFRIMADNVNHEKDYDINNSYNITIKL